jgi:hypothetical protein
MAAHNWKRERALGRINARLSEVRDIEIRDYVRDTSLHDIPANRAYRVNGVHLYVDILNLKELLRTTDVEGVTSHRRALRFLNLHYRAVHRILDNVEAIEVDFHNQRLHAVFTKPYGDEAARVHRAVATAQLIINVLARTGQHGDEIIPAARVRVGIDTGIALAVQNGRRGNREPLFLGEPANLAAKRAGGGQSAGIHLTNNARRFAGFVQVANEDASALTGSDISKSERDAALDISADRVVRDWERDLEANPIGRFEFRGHTPPLADLDLEALSPANSRRQSAASIYADIDGFTEYVRSQVLDDEGSKNVVRVLHVLRGEMDSVLHSDFGGRKIRFIGDCIHGALVEGTAQTTDQEETISTAILCAAGIRSSFDLALAQISATGISVKGLGIAVGLELGPLSLTRLGVKGYMIRCAIGQCVLHSESEQLRCSGTETAIGADAYSHASAPAKTLFGLTRKRAALTYELAVRELSGAGDKTAKAAKHLTEAQAAGVAGAALLQPASATADDYRFPARNVTPTKPAGFA